MRPFETTDQIRENADELLVYRIDLHSRVHQEYLVLAQDELYLCNEVRKSTATKSKRGMS